MALNYLAMRHTVMPMWFKVGVIVLVVALIGLLVMIVRDEILWSRNNH